MRDYKFLLYADKGLKYVESLLPPLFLGLLAYSMFVIFPEPLNMVTEGMFGHRIIGNPLYLVKPVYGNAPLSTLYDNYVNSYEDQCRPFCNGDDHTEMFQSLYSSLPDLLGPKRQNLATLVQTTVYSRASELHQWEYASIYDEHIMWEEIVDEIGKMNEFDRLHHARSLNELGWQLPVSH